MQTRLCIAHGSGTLRRVNPSDGLGPACRIKATWSTRVTVKVTTHNLINCEEGCSWCAYAHLPGYPVTNKCVDC